jgi:hypothetical protein
LRSVDIVTYRNVMRERSRLATSPGAPWAGRRTTTLRFRSSHHRTAPLRISHHAAGWTPAVKEVDRDDVSVARRKKK